MSNEIPPQRWLALGLLLFLVLVVIVFGVVPVVGAGMHYHEQREDLIFRLKRAKRIVDKKDSVLENIEKLEEQYQQQNYFITRDTVALASADLQKIIKSSISQAGGQLTSTQVLPNRTAEGLNKVVIKVRMTGDAETLRSVLNGIEKSLPVMIIDELDARPVRGRRERRTRRLIPNNDINVNFQVTGYMRPVDE